jgi:Glycosyltransferase family 87
MDGEATVPAAARRAVLVATIVGAGAGLYGWAAFALAFDHDGLIAPRVNAPGVDFMVFWAAARAAIGHDIALVYDGARFTAALNADFASWLTAPLPFHPWIYPPSFLLAVLPLGLLPFAPAYAAFMAVTFAALACALLAGEGGYRRGLLAGALALAPASALAATAGQTAFLTAALLVGGFRLAPARPVLGGAVLGVLACKPQLALMAPVALAASRQWRALLAAGATALALAAASAAVFGAEAWRAWFAIVLDPANDVHRRWTALSLEWGESVLTAARLLGAEPAVAAAAQAAAFLVAAWCVVRVFRRRGAPEARLGVLLAASVLASPHVAGYDLLPLALGAALYFSRAVAEEVRGGDVALVLAAFLAPLFGPPILSPLGFAAPLVLFVFVVMATARAG